MAKVWRWSRSEYEVKLPFLSLAKLSFISLEGLGHGHPRIDSLQVKDHTGKNVFIIEGPCCSWACCQDLYFKVKGACTYYVITERDRGLSK